MSAEKTPVLATSMVHFEMFMTNWEKLGDKNPNIKQYTDIGLKWATKYYKRMDDSKAYLIAQREFILLCPLNPGMLKRMQSLIHEYASGISRNIGGPGTS
jgi:hypothetical protein